MHADMCVADNFFILLLKLISKEETVIIQKNLKKLNRFSQFQFWEKSRENKLNDYEQNDTKLPYMNRKQH